MFCEKCGAQIPDDAVFCEKCGNKVREAAKETASAQTAQVNLNISKKNLIIGVSAVIIILLLAVLIANHKTTINLNNYIVAEFDGYNTVGKARIYFDQNAFNEKYAGKFKRVTNSVIDDPAYIVASYIGSNEKYEEGLSNGDTVDYKWDVKADKIEKELGCKIKYSDMQFTVDGLNDVETIDPFKYLKVEYSGIAPNGRLEYENDYGSDKAYGYLSLRPDKSYDLSNGDEIVFTIPDFDRVNQLVAEEFGKVFDSETKTFKVEGLSHYAEKIDELSDEAVEAMMQQAKDIVTAHVANTWSKEKLESVDEAGVYILKAKKPDAYNSLGISSVYVLLKINEYIGDDAASAPRQFYYYPVRYDEVLIDGEGKCVPDTSNYRTPRDRFNFEVQVGDHTESFYNYGYKTEDEFVEKCIKSYVDAYTYEKKDMSAGAEKESKTEDASEALTEAEEAAEEASETETK